MLCLLGRREVKVISEKRIDLLLPMRLRVFRPIPVFVVDDSA